MNIADFILMIAVIAIGTPSATTTIMLLWQAFKINDEGTDL